MISPYVRRLRLASELVALREAAGLKHEELAARIGESRAKISRLENSRIPPKTKDVIKLLDAMGVDGDKWTQIVTIAREAAEEGWWESDAKAMGARQALYADLEAGAATICEYQQNFMPGLMQLREYTQARLSVNWVSRDGTTIAGVIEGRAGRQRMLRRPDGPTYEVVLDELAVRRPSAPPPVMAAQLRHLAGKVAEGAVAIAVLPIEAHIAGYRSPFGAFSLYTYTDPGDPVVAAIESTTGDTVLTTPEETASYLERYGLLRGACLPEQEGIELITQTADRLSHQ